MILDREIYFSYPLPKRVYQFLKKFLYILFRFLGRPNWGRLEAGEKVRGERQYLTLKANEEGHLNCTSCQLCVEACPTKCLEVNLPGKKTFPHTPESFHFKTLKCITCDLCVDVCPEDALEFISAKETVLDDSKNCDSDLVKFRARTLS